MKPRIKSMIWNIRKQKNNQSEQEDKKIQKSEGSISSLWENFKRSNIFIQEYQKDKRKSKKLEIYLKK